MIAKGISIMDTWNQRWCSSRLIKESLILEPNFVANETAASRFVLPALNALISWFHRNSKSVWKAPIKMIVWYSTSDIEPITVHARRRAVSNIAQSADLLPFAFVNVVEDSRFRELFSTAQWISTLFLIHCTRVFWQYLCVDIDLPYCQLRGRFVRDATDNYCIFSYVRLILGLLLYRRRRLIAWLDGVRLSFVSSNTQVRVIIVKRQKICYNSIALNKVYIVHFNTPLTRYILIFDWVSIFGRCAKIGSRAWDSNPDPWFC